MSASFREVTDVSPRGEGEFAADIPLGWMQGRGCFGGVIFGVLLRAARLFEVDPTRLVRSFNCDVAGPVQPGPAQVHVRALRRGRSQSNLQLELRQGDAVLASGLCTMSGDRGGSAPSLEPAPPAQAALRFADLPDEQAPSNRPEFTHRYDYRNVGPLPFSGDTPALVMGFVREPGARGALDLPALSALLDSFWPALYTAARRPFAMTTVSYNAQFLPGLGDISADAPLFFRGHALTQREGYSVEFRELWYEGRLLALNQQTFAVLS